MDIITVISIGLAGVILTLTLKPHNREFSVMLSILICVIVITAAVGYLKPTVTFLNTLSQNAGQTSQYTECLLKCVGICSLASFAQDLCVDNNERGIASSIELAARCAVAITVLPILKSLAELAFDLG